MLIFRNWRDLPAEAIQPLYDAECRRWAPLGWDYAPACASIEHARRAGGLAGLIACDGTGQPVGWTYFLLHRGRLQIGTLVGPDRAILDGLLGAVLRSPEARASSGIACFLYPPVPKAHVILSSRHFQVWPHHYMRLQLCEGAGTKPKAGREALNAETAEWTSVSLPDVAAMFVRAYDGMRETRCFTIANRVEEWLLYLAHLHGGAVCGRFSAAMSSVISAPDGSVAAAIVASELSEATAHIAQVAVAPGHQRRGLGEKLVRRACERARAAGYRAITLLVADSNMPARRLYERLGFERIEEFLFAYRER